MKSKDEFFFIESNVSKVFVTKLITTDEYFEENNSPYVMIRLKEDIEQIRKALAVLEQNPFLEQVSFYINSAFVVSPTLYKKLNYVQDDDFYHRLYSKMSGEIIEVEDIKNDTYNLDLAYATIKRSDGEYELFYEGFVETYERTHVQSEYFPLLTLLESFEKAAIEPVALSL